MKNKTINDECKYWQHSCDLCGITGNDYCPRKCKDYEVNNYNYCDDYGENT